MAVIAGRASHRGRRSYGRGSSDSFEMWKCLSTLTFTLSGSSALCGIMLTVFGSTEFFRTEEMNRHLVIVGIVLLVAAVVFLCFGFVISRKTMSEENECPPIDEATRSERNNSCDRT
uniref:Uncharacterized protein n=1 Tax=Romanomermis culicivorax TaxID=13658 RepID=A0A915INB3_ROMCU